VAASYLEADAGHAEEAEALWYTLHGVGLSLGVGEWLASFRRRVLEGTRSSTSYQMQAMKGSLSRTEGQALVLGHVAAAHIPEVAEEQEVMGTVVEDDKVAEVLVATPGVEGAPGRDHRMVDSRAEAVVAEIVRKLGGENIENNEVVENLGNCLVMLARILIS
jgi:hypothetical protein